MDDGPTLAVPIPTEPTTDYMALFCAEFDLESCSPTDRLVEGLGFDSLQMLQLVYFLEDEFAIEIDETRVPFDSLTVTDTFLLSQA